ncbi:hypothetical protein CDQ92_10605 [Sphingopyxis bauzanensis]|uniref:Uncharacterized protein n=1 Tax=Sphingopyxis bauzanensis TaxID=651663 RepID=A0A246JWM5_9SPHN|nr:DUF499 domain-containing protein [Sphingopyxis bauzanensis]OWQ97460.1 hypothetical protein CDQ92_10605 [Sphingopyxis bauzanensis]GGJ36285.1 hypothetical protein GCM10011393_03400 [Sphingopyxis bauzanensis]
MASTTIFDNCQPRQDILNGTMSEAEFAARLGPVLSGQGPPDYVDARRFFANTYPTAGLKELLGQVLGRLSGLGSSSAVFRLDTSFGGGKTHGLIALIHGAREGASVPNMDEFVSLPDMPAGTSVAAFDGEASDPSNGRIMGDGIRAFTPWGEIAYQIGGAAGYEIVRKSDEMRRAPGADTLAEVFGDRSVLVVLDELGEYLRKCPDAHGRDQISAFLKALFAAVESRPRAAVVFTLAVRPDGKATDAFARENEEISRIVGELESVSGRKATILNPTSDDETAAVLKRRLFERVDVPKSTVDEYCQLWTQYRDRIDAGHQGVEARTGLEASYPFHPDLLDTLTGKTATLADFQRVRGMLRILAKTVANVWAARPKDAALIHTHHVDLGDEGIRREFTTRLNQSAYDSAILNDIDGKAGRAALAASIDADRFSGLLPYASYVARTVFIHTIAYNNELRGLTPAQLRYSILSPAADLSFVADAEAAFIQGSAYLDDRPGAPLRFNAEANLTQIIAREERGVDTEAMRVEADSRIKEIFGGNGSFESIPFPAGAFDVPDDIGDGKPRLAIIHHQALGIGNVVDEVPELISTIYQRKGQDGGGLRQLRNNLVFLVADERHVRHLTATISRHLALQELKRPDRLSELADHQKAQVIELAQRSQTDIAVAIQQCYRHLFYPSRTALGGGSVSLDLATIDQHSASERPGSGQTQIVRQLTEIGKLRTPEDQPDLPQFVRDRTPLKRTGQMTAADLRAEFRRDPSLPMHVGDDPFKKLVIKGINDGIFVYQREGLTAGKGDPVPSIVIDGSSIISTADYARDHGIFPRPAKSSEPKDPAPGDPADPGFGQGDHGAAPAPAGGNTVTDVARPFVGQPGDSLVAPTTTAQTFSGEGVLKDALSTVFQRARAAKIEKVSRLALTPFEVGHFFMLLNVVESVPGATKSANATIEFETVAKSIITMTIEGAISDAKQTREYVEPQLRAATEKNVSATIQLDFADGLALGGDEPEKIIERLTKFGASAAFVEVTAEA